MSTTVGWCERWNQNNITARDYSEDIACEDIVISAASMLHIFLANVYNTVMANPDRSKWIKMPAVLILDTLLLLTVPAIALAEAVLKLALAVITLPLLLLYIYDKDSNVAEFPQAIAATAIYSLAQIPNAIYTAHLSHTSSETIRARANGWAMVKWATCNVVYDGFFR